MPSTDTRQPEHIIFQGHRFAKTSGPTGDWIVFHNSLQPTQVTPHELRWLCNRTAGVGGSGVIMMTTDHDQPQAHTLTAWDANGISANSLAEAARASTSVVATLGQDGNPTSSHHVFQTSHGTHSTVYTSTHIGADLGAWRYTTPETATEVGSDVLVMAVGLTDPRPGLSIQLDGNHVLLAVETPEELAAIDLGQAPSVEPHDVTIDSINVIVPDTPLISQGMGQLHLRQHSNTGDSTLLAAGCASAAIAFQNWSGLAQIMLWNITTERGSIIVQLHADQRVSTYTQHRVVYSGRL